MMLYLIYLLIC